MSNPLKTIVRNLLGELTPKSKAALTVACGSALFLSGYEFVRTPSYTLLKHHYGSQALPWVMGSLPFALLGILWLYTRCIGYFGPRRTLAGTCIISCLIFASCYLGLSNDIAFFSIILFLAREAYVTLVIEQFWSFINSNLNSDEGKRLNGIICGISSLGAITGGLLVSRLALPLGTDNLILFAIVSTMASLAVVFRAMRMSGEPKPTEDASDHFAIGELRQHKPLRTLVYIVALSQVYSAMVTLNFQEYLGIAIESTDAQSAYSGQVFALLNLFAAIAQFFVTPFLLTRFSTRQIHMMLPLVCLLSAMSFFIHPSLAMASFVFILFKTCDYSIFRGAKEVIYIPYSFDVRYRVKEFIDVFAYRTAKSSSSLLVGVAKSVGAASGSSGLLVAGSIACSLWAYASLGLANKDNAD